jgi:hypothetical protein
MLKIDQVVEHTCNPSTWATQQNLISKHQNSQGPVAHACNPSYSRSGRLRFEAHWGG